MIISSSFGNQVMNVDIASLSNTMNPVLRLNENLQETDISIDLQAFQLHLLLQVNNLLTTTELKSLLDSSVRMRQPADR